MCNRLILRVQPLFPFAIRGIPKYPGKHLSHKFPPTPGLHEQWPELRSQVEFTLPVFKNERRCKNSFVCNLSQIATTWSLESVYYVMGINIMQRKMVGHRCHFKVGQRGKKCVRSFSMYLNN